MIGGAARGRDLLGLGVCCLVVITATPAFMLRLTGVMDDSVFWVVAKSLDSGKLLYREVFFTQPPLFIFIPQMLWMATSNIFVHRAFLLGLWLVNGSLFYLALDRADRTLRLLAVGLFLVSAFVLQSYALHTEILILTVFLIGMLALVRRSVAAGFVLGVAASAALCFKAIGPLVFVPCLYSLVTARGSRTLGVVLAGALVPVALVGSYLAQTGSISEFWQEVVLDNTNLGLSATTDWFGYFTLIVAPLLVPAFIALILLDRRPTDLDWWLTVAVFGVLLVIEVLRGARHYGLLNLCVLAWMAVKSQGKFDVGNRAHTIGLGVLVASALVFHVATVREILARGSILDELSAAQFAHTLPRGSLQVFGNSPPRVYMLLNEFSPAYAYLFVYDTNQDRVNWDSYRGMIASAPPDYIAVEDDFAAIEYGHSRSSELVDANSVKTWIDQHGGYRRLEVGGSLRLTMYQRRT